MANGPDLIHPALKAAFTGLEAAGVRWCLLRGDPRRVREGGDVDLLVERRDMRQAGRLLEELGFVEISGAGYGTHRSFMERDEPGRHAIRLDLFDELAFGARFELATQAEAACLARRWHDGPVARLHGDDAFWAALLHALFDGRRLDERRAEELRASAEAAIGAGPLAEKVDAVTPPGWSAERIAACVRDGCLETLELLGPDMTRAWRRRHGLPGLARRARITIRRARDRWRRNRPIGRWT